MHAAAATTVGSRVDGTSFTLATGPLIADLCLHGRCCYGIALLVDLPSGSTGSPATGEDPTVYVFLDFRPIGVRPFGWCQSSNSLHLPTVLRAHDKELPGNVEIEVVGRETQGYYIDVASGDIIVFRAVPDSDYSTSSQQQADGGDEGTESGTGQDEDPIDDASDHGSDLSLRSRSPRGDHGLELASLTSAPPADVASSGTAPFPAYLHPRRASISADEAENFAQQLRGSRPITVYGHSETTSAGCMSATAKTFAPCTFQVYIPGYYVLTTTPTVGLPCTEQEAFRYVRTSLEGRLPPFFDFLFPTQPQIGRDYGSLVLVPTWHAPSGRHTIVFDMSGIEGPIYAKVVVSPMTFWECQQEAARHSAVTWSLFVAGSLAPQTPGESFHVGTGYVLQFRPLHSTPEWFGHLAERLGHHVPWLPDPALPESPPGNRLLVLRSDQHRVFDLDQVDAAPLTSRLADLVERTADDVLFVRPLGQCHLRDYCHEGLPCQGALAVFPLRALPGRQGRLLFLDGRPANVGVITTYTEGIDDLLGFADWLGLRPPALHHVVCARVAAAEQGMSPEGSVLIFGYRLNSELILDAPPPSSLASDDSRGEGESDEEDAPDDQAGADRADSVSANSDPGVSNSNNVGCSGQVAATDGQTRKDHCPGCCAFPLLSTCLPADDATSGLVTITKALAQCCIRQASASFALLDFTCRTVGKFLSAPAWLSLRGFLHTVQPWVSRDEVGPTAQIFRRLEGIGTAASSLTGWRRVSQLCCLDWPEPLWCLDLPVLWFLGVPADIAVNVCAGQFRLNCTKLIAGSAPAGRACKYLQEPQGRSQAEGRHLNDLRSITHALGGQWLPSLPPLMDLGGIVDSDASGSDSEHSDHTQWIHYAVLKEGFRAENATVAIQVPCTEEELVVALQAARCPSIRNVFPSLLSILPQPRPGTAVFLAAPNWDRTCHGVCLDTSLLDRRLFTASIPDYVCRHELVQIAGLPHSLDMDIWLVHDEMLLTTEEPVHVFPGALICFLPAAYPPPSLPVLGQMLLRRVVVTPDAEVPAPSVDSAYCLVTHDHCGLHLINPEEHIRYRSSIAEALQIHIHRLRLFAAYPRQTDVAIEGTPCRNVIAVAESNADGGFRGHLVLLDCRALGQRWRLHHVSRGRLDLDALFQSFDAPRGWQVAVLDQDEQTGLQRTVPGQVFRLGYVPQRLALSSAASSSSSLPVAQQTPPDRRLELGAWRGDMWGSIPEDSEELDFAAGPCVDQGATTMHFLILSPEYQEEIVSVAARLPSTTADILPLVAREREAERAHLFPQMLPVQVQPPFSFACLLAIPAWPAAGIPVLFVFYHSPVRLFAEFVPASLSVGDVFRLVGIPEDAQTQIFVKDVPWAVPAEARIFVQPASMIKVRTHGTATAWNSGLPMGAVGLVIRCALNGGVPRLAYVPRLLTPADGFSCWTLIAGYRWFAWVDPGITAGHATADHFAAVVCCTFRHGRNPGNAHKIERILGHVPELPWSLNVNDHAAVLSEYLFTELANAFPLSAKRLRGSFFSEDTAAVHAQIARLRHALRDRLAAQRLSYLRCAFDSWRSPDSEFGALLAGKWSATLQTVIALIGRQISVLGKDLRRRCRADKRAHLESLAKDVDQARPGDTQIALKRLLRPRKFRRGGPMPLPFLKRTDGTVCQSFDQVQEEWRRHFAESWRAEFVSRQAATPARETLDCGLIPSLVALRDAFRNVSAMKATGPDGLPPALCARFPTSLATVFWPVLLKTLCYGSEPVGFKGGILVQSSLEKVLHKVLRPVATAELNRRALPLQIGGRAGLSHGIGFYCTRLFLDFAQQRNLSAGILFCDLAAAYYAIVRETLVGIDTDSCSIVDIAGQLRGATPFPCQGSSWADVMFSLLFARVLERRGDFSEQGFQPVIPWSGSRRPVAYDARRAGQVATVVQDVVYADDLATCLVAPSAASLSQAARHIAGVSVDTLLSHGLRPNIGPKKTTVLLAHRGSGARAAREAVFTRAKGRLPVLCENVDAILLDVVPHYRHLGSVLSFNGSMIPEARARVQHAKQLFKEGRATVFCTPHIALAKRVALFRSHVLSAMLSGCGAWPSLCKSSWRALESCYFTMLRAMLRIPHASAQNWTTERVLARIGLPDLFGLVSADRLRFLAQLVRNGPDAAFALLQHSPRALEAFRSAAEWFVTACSSTSCLRALADTWDDWVAVFSTPRRFKGLLKRATAWHVGALESLAAFQCFCRQYWSPVPVAPVSVEVATHACLICAVAFFDFHSWSAHAARSHGYRSRSRRFAHGLTCRACGVKFATLRRHQRHLIDSVRCCQAVEMDLPTLLPVDHSEAGHVQSVSSAGGDFTLVPAAGPDISAALLAALREGCFDSDTAIFECVKSAVEPFHVLRNTLSLWISELGTGQLFEWASDVLLCLQVDLLCDSASRARRDVKVPEEFSPLLRGFPVAESWTGLHFLTDRDCWTADFAFMAGDLPATRRIQFWQPPPSDACFAGLSLDVPAPALVVPLAWAPASCSLRALRGHIKWLHLLLAWLGFAITLAELG
ncbi:unnamed protein product, partial [Symbiodinium sp. CCMP2456]